MNTDASETTTGSRSGIRPADRLMRRLLRIPDDQEPGSLLDARNALGTGVVLSGLRCLFTYLVFPLLGPIGSSGAILWPLSLGLGALAVVFSIRSMRRFWAANHRHRWTYTAFAMVIVVYVFVDLGYRLLTSIF